MKWFYNTVALLRKHGYNWQARFDFVGILASVVLFFIFKDEICLGIALTFLLFLLWEFDDAMGKEKREELTLQIADMKDELVILRAENEKLQDDIQVYKTRREGTKENPIKNNRLVGDKTFAVRLKSFVEEVRCSDPMSEEEAVYLAGVANRLLKWQTKTVRKDTEEYRYLERLGLMPSQPVNAKEHTPSSAKQHTTRRKNTTKRNNDTGNENKN